MKCLYLTFPLLLACGILRGGVPSLPLLFEQHETGCLARTAGGSVFVSKDGALLRTRQGSVRLRFAGARASQPRAENPLRSVSNYLTGNDPAAWRRGIPHFAKVRSSEVYPGIDVVYYGKDGELEYDFVVAPGANARSIDLIVDGATRLSTDAGGNLLIATGKTTIRQLRPVVYQKGGEKIEARYRVTGRNRVRFEIGHYDHSRELVIDPVIQYTRYIGRLGQESATGVAVDAAGNAIYVGETTSEELAVGAVVQRIKNPDNEVFVAKVSPTGEALFLTYLGGNGPDTARAVALDPSGNIFVAGTTASKDFPTRNPVQASASTTGEADGFVSQISASGTDLLFSTYLGGNDYDFLNGVAVDPSGSVWVSGWTTSTNFPVRGGYQSGPGGGGGDVFVTEINPARGQILYSTYVGGNGQDLAGGLAVDSRGYVYVTGSTTSTVFPVSARAAQPKLAGKQDMFFFQLNPDTNDLVASTFFGGTGDDVGQKVAVDSAGSAYITGYTDSVNFPVTSGASQPSIRGGNDMFVVKITVGRVDWATYLGGTGEDFGGAITVDGAGSAYVGGWTNSSNFPTRSPIQSTYQGGNYATQQYDATVTRLSPSGNSLLFSTYLGGSGEDKIYGIALDRSGNIHLAGSTTSTNLPGAVNAFGSSAAALYDGTGVRLSADTAASFLGANPGVLNLTTRSTDGQPIRTAVSLSGTAGSVTFTTSTNASWLRVDPVSGTAPGNITITVDPNLLVAGENRGEVVIQSTANSVRIPVVVTSVAVPDATAVSPASLAAGAGSTTITVTGTGITQASWVEVNEIRVTSTFVDARTIRAVIPEYLLQSAGTLRVAVVNADGRSNVLQIAVGSAAPVLTPSGITHGATNENGAIAPGEIVIIAGTQFGPASVISAAPVNGFYGTSLSGVSVLFDGVAAPLLWTAQGRAAVVAPYSLAGKTSTQVVVEAAGARSQPVVMPVQATNPGLFTADSSGRGQVAASNQDGSLNRAGSAAPRGSVVVLYATGEGTVSPSLGSGQVVTAEALTRPILPVAVFVGGAPAVVEYAGGAPGQISGLLQLNIRIPENSQTGDSVSVVLRIGEYQSPAGVTLAVR